jgi:hypothetical protein
MSNLNVMSCHWEFLIEQELYVLGMIFNGLPEVDTPTIKMFFEDKALVKKLVDCLALKEQHWLDRRTNRNIGFDGQRQESGHIKLVSVLEVINTLLKKLSPSLEARQLFGDEHLKLIDSLKTQANISTSSCTIGFFMVPMDFLGIREGWLLIGLLAQLLCVFAQKSGEGAFITHGVDRTMLPASLATLEYVVTFG